MRNAPAYEVRSLKKVYEPTRVVANDGLTFSVEQGETFGLLGPNGAGKTTLVRQLVGLLAPTAGEVRLFGEAVIAGPGADRRIGRTVAYLPQDPLGLGELRVAEALRWTGMLRGLPKSVAESEADELLDALGLHGLVDRQVRRLSGGQRRLVQIGMTLAGRLQVVILDEPTADIDPRLRRRIWELVPARAAAGAAVVLVTHDVAEAERALDRLLILDLGRAVASGTPAQLKARLAHRTRLELVVADDPGVDPRALADDISGDSRVRGRRVSAWVPADEAIRTLEKVVSWAGPEALEDVRLLTPTLEDVYLEMTGRPMAEETPQ
jgi:ABC-type multidrug transport system ATPase subunit